MRPTMDGANGNNSLDYIWFFDGYSVEECDLLRTSFEVVKPDIDAVGTAAFVNLFDAHKDAFKVLVDKKLMPQTKEDVMYSWETKAHSQRVLSSIERCINRIRQKDAFLEFVRNLAMKHATHGTKPDHLLALMNCLRRALFDAFEAVPPSRWADNRPGRLQRRSTEPANFISKFELSPSDELNKAMNRSRDECDTCYDNNDDDDDELASSIEAAKAHCKKVELVWDKFFITLSLAMVNGIKRNRRSSSLSLKSVILPSSEVQSENSSTASSGN